MPFLTAPGGPIELVAVPAGEFRMGSDNELFSEAPAHAVRVAAFLLGKYPVTRGQFGADGAPDHPMTGVTWDQADEFCRRVGGRLPTEAEWEYACRAGTTADYFFGPWGPVLDESEVPAEARTALLDYAWYHANADGTRPVGGRRPNPWGLHDLLGNVWEWCADPWRADYAAPPNPAQTRRVVRGGAWDMNAFRCRSAYRSFDHRDAATDRVGFRVAVATEPAA